MVPEVVAEIAHQTRRPDRVVVCHATPGDVAQIPKGAAELILSPVAGISAQRNLVIVAVPECDVVVFFDDDFLPGPSWLAGVEASGEELS